MALTRWSGSVIVVVLMLGLGACSSSSSGDGSTDDGATEPTVLTGAWWGYNKNVSGEGTVASAGMVGVQINERNQITHTILYPGEWTPVETPSQIDEITPDAVYRIEGTNWVEPGDDTAVFIILASDLEHMGLLLLDDVEDRIESYALQKDEAVVDTFPEPPTVDVDASALVGTWTGTAFDVLVASPPEFNTVEEGSISLGNSEGLEPTVDTVYMGATVGADTAGPLSANIEDLEFGFYIRTATYYGQALLPTPDLFGLTYVVCGNTEVYNCGDFAGAAISLDPLSADDGWAFGWLELQPE